MSHSPFFCGERPRSIRYGRTAAVRLIVQCCNKDDSFFVFTCNGAEVEWNWQGKTGTRENPVPVPLCAPQIPHELTRDRTRASAASHSPIIECTYGIREVMVRTSFRIAAVLIEIIYDFPSPFRQFPFKFLSTSCARQWGIILDNWISLL